MTQKYCPSYDGYSVTNDGHIFTHRRRFGRGKGHGGGVIIDWQYQKELNQYNGHGGYLYVSISTNGKQRSIPIHTLLLDAFVGERPIGNETRHLDGNPLNNALDNLCYGSRKENAQDRIKNGKRGYSILRDADVKDIKYNLHAKQGLSIAEIARRYNRGESTIRDIVKGRRWKHI